LCCAAHRAGSRLAPLTRAAAANASGLRPSASALRLASGLCPPRWRLAAGVSRQPGSPVSQLPGHKAVPLAWVVPPMTAVKPGAAGCQQTLRSSC
ncbi:MULTISPECIES: hypothetical protein, partial [Citrobacter freundii complex]